MKYDKNNYHIQHYTTSAVNYSPEILDILFYTKI